MSYICIKKTLDSHKVHCKRVFIEPHILVDNPIKEITDSLHQLKKELQSWKKLAMFMYPLIYNVSNCNTRALSTFNANN